MSVPGSKRRRTSLLLLLTVIFAGALRVHTVLETDIRHPVRADAADYVFYALNLKHFGIYSRDRGGFPPSDFVPDPDALRSPGYPLFIAPLIDWPLVVGDPIPIGIVQAFIGALVTFLAYLITMRIAGVGPALVSALLVATSPVLISMTPYILTETLFSGLVAAAFAVLAFALAAPRNRRRVLVAFAVSGALLGLAALVRPVLLLLPAMFLIAAFIWYRQQWRMFVLLAAVFVLVYSPWPLRNAFNVNDGSGRVLTTNFIWHGAYPDFKHEDRDESHGFPYRFDERKEFMSEGVVQTIEVIAERAEKDPWRYFSWYLFGKPAALWQWGIIAGQGDVFVYPVSRSPFLDSAFFKLVHAIHKVLHWVFVFAALAMTVITMVRPRLLVTADMNVAAMRIVSLLLMYVTAVHMVGAPFPRYSVPFRPELLILATCFFFWLWRIRLALPRPARKQDANTAVVPLDRVEYEPRHDGEQSGNAKRG